MQRSSYKDQKRGLYKIVFDPSTRRVLGLHVVAPGGGDIVQGLSLGLRLAATVEDLASMHHVFPTFGEGFKASRRASGLSSGVEVRLGLELPYEGFHPTVLVYFRDRLEENQG